MVDVPLLRSWLRVDIGPKIAVIEEHVPEKYHAAVLSLCGTPLFHFANGEGGEPPITNKQHDFLLSLADRNKKLFFAIVNDRKEDYPNIGSVEDILSQLTQSQASNIISLMVNKGAK